MRPLAEMATIQIEWTSACVLKCSNCTRFCGTHKVPFFLEEDKFRAAIDSLVEYAKQPHAIVGAMGGEPMLHPQFAEFCEYALSKIPRAHLGLWSTFPDSPNYRKQREVICKTFGVILLNDHSRNDILHAPVLMAAEDHFRKPCPDQCSSGKVYSGFEDLQPGESGVRMQTILMCQTCKGKGHVADEEMIALATERCWIQESWSAAVNPKGAWFCEVAAALSDLFDGPEGWNVEPGWWKRTTKDFTAQREWACRRCGAALPLTRIRNSQDERDDVSVSSLERLKAVKSRKVAKGDFELREKFEFDPRLVNNTYPNQTYQDAEYRRGIAARYGIVLVPGPLGYWEPRLQEDMPGFNPNPPESLFKIMQQQYTD